MDSDRQEGKKIMTVRINTNPVAQRYSDEKIIEYSSPNGGGLIAFREMDDGTLIVEPYRHDTTVVISVPKRS